MRSITSRASALPPGVWLALILLATAVYYAPTLNDWFFADDALFLRRSQTTDWGTWLAQSFDYRDPRPIPEINQYRPMYALTFRLQYELFELNAWAYHAVNLAVHLGAVTLLWFIARRLPMPAWAAHLTAALFALHPTYTEAVAWIANGNSPMAVLFALLGFLLFMKFADGGRYRLALLAASTISVMVALLYHPIVTPYCVAIGVWWFLLAREPRDVLRPRSWLSLLPMILVVIPYLLIQRWVREQDFNEQVKYQFGDHMFGIAIDYLALAWDATLDTKAAAVAVAAMIAATIVVLAPVRGKLPPLGILAVVWYYAALGPDLLFVFGAQGRLMYAPGAPLALLLGAAAAATVQILLVETKERLPALARYAALASIAAAVVLFCAVTLPRERELPPNVALVEAQSQANERMIEQLRREVPSVPEGGTLYIVNPPGFTVHLGLENILRSFVRLYYGEILVEPVPFTRAPFWDEQQVRDAMGPDDRIFVFE